MTPLARRSELQCRTLTQVRELEALEEDWRALYARCPDLTPFQSPSWLLPWCHVRDRAASISRHVSRTAAGRARAVPDVRRGRRARCGFRKTGYTSLHGDALSWLLFPVADPEQFDAVQCDEHGRVQQIRVKQAHPGSRWVWGGLRMSGRVLSELHALWLERDSQDAYVGALINAYIARGGEVWASRVGRAYFDVGTLDGYRHAMQSLSPPTDESPFSPASVPRRAP